MGYRIETKPLLSGLICNSSFPWQALVMLFSAVYGTSTEPGCPDSFEAICVVMNRSRSVADRLILPPLSRSIRIVDNTGRLARFAMTLLRPMSAGLRSAMGSVIGFILMISFYVFMG